MMTQHTAAVPPEAERGVRHDVRPLTHIVLRNPFRSRGAPALAWGAPGRPQHTGFNTPRGHAHQP
ncbi:hypothetical protein, partial [Streptomyces mirabilis]|uniref:hypothetical protein n=1 Tax=Streptomyces mirabilis TaxID=68239 RepID=UPI0036A83A0D